MERSGVRKNVRCIGSVWENTVQRLRGMLAFVVGRSGNCVRVVQGVGGYSCFRTWAWVRSGVGFKMVWSDAGTLNQDVTVIFRQGPVSRNA